LISAINIAEVIDRLVRAEGYSDAEVASVLELAADAGLRVVDVTGAIGRAAGSLRAKHYERSRMNLSMADCVALATAQAHQATLMTGDRMMIGVARAERIAVAKLG
jgi:predicted nucleic acid-binding protein